MSPAPRVVLLDSCAYFRLAQSLHPLLHEPFGPPPPYSLFVLEALDREFSSSPRLRHKFAWVGESQYRLDRQAKRYRCKGKVATAAQRAFSFLAAYAMEQRFNVAPEDLQVLSVGVVRSMPIVSDDRAVQQIATAHGITCWDSLDLLKLMVDSNRIALAKVEEVVQYWGYTRDLPMGEAALRAKYKALFGCDCPV